MASDVAIWLHHHNISRSVVVGHSMGGKVAMALATSRRHQHLLDGLVVLDIAPVGYAAGDGTGWEGNSEIIDACLRLPIGDFKRKKECDAFLESIIPNPGLRSFILTNIETCEHGLRWRINLPAIANSLPEIASFRTIESSAVFPRDTFFICGGNSKYVKVSHMDTINRMFTSNSLVTIRGAGHWVHSDAPNDVMTLITRYLERTKEVDARK
jgi:abhydrolase domain-containing protein 11